MKIKILSFFNPNEIELDTNSNTLGALLYELSNNQRIETFQFFDRERREIYSDCGVMINGCFLTDGLDTKLKDGDLVEIRLVIIGGG